MDQTVLIAQLFTIVLVLTIITNIIVQVLKGVLPSSIPTSPVALIVAFIVTLAAAVVYFNATEAVFELWMLIAIIGLAFMVAMSAMYGFDKFKAMFDRLKADGGN